MQTLAEQFTENPYAWPGGYPVYAIMADGGCLCKDCVKTEHARMAETDPDCPDDKQWIIEALAINWEDADLYCDHCNNPIESAYGDD